jgi:hypothetical protein
MRPCLGHLDLEKGGGFHPDDLQHHALLALPLKVLIPLWLSITALLVPACLPPYRTCSIVELMIFPL